MDARHLSLAFLLVLAACGTDPVSTVDAGRDASLDAKPTDAKSDAPSDGAPSDVGQPDVAPPFDAGDAAIPCNGSTTGQCGAGYYCDAVACGLGTCKLAPAETNTLNAICGCDGVTYWNATVAQNKGVTPNGSGECKPGKMCGGIANIQCPAGTKCNFKVGNKSSCAISDVAGTCWGLPTQCPQILIGPQTRECLSNKCTEACAIIKLGLTYYDDNTCPQ